jgi:hypothetical protein
LALSLRLSADANFVSDPLSPGTHTAKIQFKDDDLGPVYAGSRSPIILHK